MKRSRYTEEQIIGIAHRGGGLLILAGEIVFADRPPDAVEDPERLTIGMQGLTATTREAFEPPDRLDLVHLVGFGDRRKP